MEHEGYTEHRFSASDGMALVVYCATCARILAEYAGNDTSSLTLARMTVDSHVESFSQGHLVTIGDIPSRRIEYLTSDGYRDMTNND